MSSRVRKTETVEGTQSDVKVIKIGGLNEFPELKPRPWRFVREEQLYELMYTPLTYEQQELVSVMFPAPTPPMKEVGDEKERIRNKAMGKSSMEPNLEDPDYKAALKKNETERNLGCLWYALGYSDSVKYEVFAKGIATKLTPGEIVDLAGVVLRSSMIVDPLRVNGFFPLLSR